eukprot:11855506-Alexandrium_andersonii.AAC.1
MGADAFVQQLGTPRGSGPSHSVRAPSPIVLRRSEGDPERPLKGLCGGGLVSFRGVSAIGEQP